MRTETLPVIFRAEREQGQTTVTAVFPTEPATNDPHTFTVYAHVGQHSAGTLEWYGKTRRATPAEYAPLLRELQGIYGVSHAPNDPAIELRVVQRMTQTHDRARREALERMKGY